MPLKESVIQDQRTKAFSVDDDDNLRSDESPASTVKKSAASMSIKERLNQVKQ